MRRSLSRSERLTEKAAFDRVFDQPDLQSGCHGAKLVVRRNERSVSRFAVSTVRKFGNAVERNYARRVLKEIYRNKKQDLPSGYDIIIILYPGNYSYHDREQQFMKLIRRSGFCHGE